MLSEVTTEVLKNERDLYDRCLIERRELGVGLLVNKRITGNKEDYYTNNEKIAYLAIRLNKRYKVKVVQRYVPTSSHDDNAVKRFDEDVELAVAKLRTQCTVLVENFKVKVDKKQAEKKRTWVLWCWL